MMRGALESMFAGLTLAGVVFLLAGNPGGDGGAAGGGGKAQQGGAAAGGQRTAADRMPLPPAAESDRP